MIHSAPNKKQQSLLRANSRWIARGLKLLTMGSHAYDAATGVLTPYTWSSDAPTLGVNAFGIGRTQSGAGSYNTTRNVFTNKYFTAIWVGSLPSSNLAVSSAISQSGAESAIMFGGNFDDQFSANSGAAGRLSLTCLDVGASVVNRSHAYVSGAVDGKPHVYLMRRNGTTVTAWIDGAPQTVTTTGGFPTADSGFTSDSDTFRVCGSSAGGSNFVGILNATALLQTALTDAECAQLSTWTGVLGLAPRAARQLWFGISGGAATNEGVASAAGASVATALSGSIAAAAATSAAVATAGAIANATGASAAVALSASVATAAGAGTATAHSGATAQSLGAGNATALSGSTASAAGTSAATAYSAAASIASAAGSGTAAALSGSIGSSAGTSVAAGYSSASSIAAASGSSSGLAIAGFIARSTASSSAIAVSGAVAQAAGSSAASAVGLSGNAGIGEASGSSTASSLSGSVAQALGFATAFGAPFAAFKTADPRYLARPVGRRFTART